ncbi:hypothetical protein O988_06753 [Pseudogymnoascus sp. VKM F-3808]|nr:hypothetical protein O988_06753 [Pseudogymnoascus sp. VKM F-3808]
MKLLSVTRSFWQTARSRPGAKWGGGDEFRDIDWSNEWKLGKEGSGSYRPDMVVIAGFVDSAQVFIFTKKANTAHWRYRFVCSDAAAEEAIEWSRDAANAPLRAEEHFFHCSHGEEYLALFSFAKPR